MDQVAPARTSRQVRLSGWVVFAAVMLMIAGAFNVIDGIAALANARIYTSGGVVVLNHISAWGWVWLIFGVVEVLAGAAVLSRRMWARLFAIAVIGLNAIAHMLFIPAYPFWSLLILVVDFILIWALATMGEPARA